MIKRACDIVFSLTLLVLLSLLMVIIAMVIRLSSRGPALFRGIRVGRCGKPFRMYKFRTMVANAESLGGSCTADNDPRITKIGRWLRKYKLDEIPQLLNVLKGEMSLVGPRPELPQYVAMFTEQEKRILSVRPGITDWASLWDSDEGAVLARSDDPEAAYLEKIRPEKIRLQLKYVSERNLRVDLALLFRTVLLVGKRSLSAVVSFYGTRQA